MFAALWVACGSSPAPAGPPVVVVDAHRMVKEGAPSHATEVVVMGSGPRIDVVIEDLVHYCAPPPSFTVTPLGEVLEVTVVRPQGVSRCFGAYHVELHVEPVGEVNKLLLRSAEGRVLANVAIP
ncbi:MAG: hypothetical protein ABMA64_29635 [Myxococcota bacterium]